MKRLQFKGQLQFLKRVTSKSTVVWVSLYRIKNYLMLDLLLQQLMRKKVCSYFFHKITLRNNTSTYVPSLSSIMLRWSENWMPTKKYMAHVKTLLGKPLIHLFWSKQDFKTNTPRFINSLMKSFWFHLRKFWFWWSTVHMKKLKQMIKMRVLMSLCLI
jgi:hypothetical protein